MMLNLIPSLNCVDSERVESSCSNLRHELVVEKILTNIKEGIIDFKAAVLALLLESTVASASPSCLSILSISFFTLATINSSLEYYVFKSLFFERFYQKYYLSIFSKTLCISSNLVCSPGTCLNRQTLASF